MDNRVYRGFTSLRTKGFSLVELMVTVSVMAIALAIATPSFIGIMAGNRIAGTANELTATIQLSRIEAIRRNASVTICGSANSDTATPSCSGSSSWSGWISFVDVNFNGTREANETLLHSGSIASPAVIAVSSNISTAIRFQPDGLATDNSGVLLNGIISVCVPTARLKNNIRNVAIAAGSRVVIRRASGAGLCPTPANS
jgi:type IV fimbrial biogenesis protein FimT